MTLKTKFSLYFLICVDLKVFYNYKGVPDKKTKK